MRHDIRPLTKDGTTADDRISATAPTPPWPVGEGRRHLLYLDITDRLLYLDITDRPLINKRASGALTSPTAPRSPHGPNSGTGRPASPRRGDSHHRSGSWRRAQR